MKGRPWRQFYSSRRWRRVRLAVLQTAGWLCQCADCQAHGLRKPAEVVHHKVKWQEATGPDRERLKYEAANLQAVSRTCHQALHAEENNPMATAAKSWQASVHHLMEKTA